jgi:hypothetical protein
MSKYDDDQKKFTWIFYCFLSFVFGTVFSGLFMTSSTEKLMKYAYSSLPAGCQKVFDEKAQMYIDSEEAKSEAIEQYR